MVKEAFGRIRCWLKENAPRTLDTLLEAPSSEELEAFAAEFNCTFPEGLALLYAECGGQSADSPVGLFNGFTMMPLHGVDGLESAWNEMLDAVEAGEEWATSETYPFANDYAGGFLCVDMNSGDGAAGRIVSIVDGETNLLADDMQSFLETVAGDLERRRFLIDESVVEWEPFEILFDASRPRTPGDVVKHSIFDELEIDATIEDPELHASPFDKDPPKHGFYVRLVPRKGEIRVAEVRLEDASRRSFGRCGHGTGAGMPGFFVYLLSRSPIPQGSRLTLVIERARVVSR